MTKLSPVELLEIVRTYYPPVRPRDLEEWGAHEALRASPHYRRFMDRRRVGDEQAHEWRALIRNLAPDLPTYKLWDHTAPSHNSYEAAAYWRDAPRPTHGTIRTSLVVRVSYLAPVYEIYESHVRIVFVGPDKDRINFRDRKRMHDISEPFLPAADAFAQAIADQYGYQRLYPDVLDLQIMHMLNWDSGGSTSSMAEALFAEYRY